MKYKMVELCMSLQLNVSNRSHIFLIGPLHTLTQNLKSWLMISNTF